MKPRKKALARWLQQNKIEIRIHVLSQNAPVTMMKADFR